MFVFLSLSLVIYEEGGGGCSIRPLRDRHWFWLTEAYVRNRHSLIGWLPTTTPPPPDIWLRTCGHV